MAACPDLPMDVLLYALEYQWPLSEDLFADLGEIARRSCVSKEFQHKMYSIKDMRISYYLQQYPPLKCLSLDVQQFAIRVIKNCSASCRGPDVDDNTAAGAVSSTALAGITVFRSTGLTGEGGLVTCHVGSQTLVDFAIKWRGNRLFNNINSDFPDALEVLFQMLIQMCSHYHVLPASRIKAAREAKSDEYQKEVVVINYNTHEDLAMWLIFLANIENVFQTFPTTAHDRFFIIYNECDHVHNGFRKLGDISATRSTRKGYYYGTMQPGYVSQYEDAILKNVSAQRTKLSTLFLARFSQAWLYQETCRLDDNKT
jgi:hypothetical protein